MKENLNLNTVFTNIANAIREKTNTSDLIKPNDMAEKINNITLNIGSNILVTPNKSNILGSSEHNKLCIVTNQENLQYKVSNKKLNGGEYILSGNLNRTYSTKIAISSYNNKAYYYNDSRGFYEYDNELEGWNLVNEYKIRSYSLYFDCICSYENKILVFYQYKSDGSYSYQDSYGCLIYNIDDRSVTNRYFSKQTYFNNAVCISYKDKIYIAGGYYISGSSNIYSSNIFVYDFVNNTFSSIEGALTSKKCSFIYAFNNNLYFSRSSDYLLTKYDLTNNTISDIEKRSDISSIKYGFGLENKLYLNLNGSTYLSVLDLNDFNLTTTEETVNLNYSYSNGQDIAYIFNSTNPNRFELGHFDLNENLVYLYTNGKANYNFELLNNEIIIPLYKVYIGDSNNTAQLADAYLYDETQSSWVNVNTNEVLTE